MLAPLSYRYRFTITILLLGAILFAPGCKDKDENEGTDCLGNYPIGSFLSHYSDDIIVPDYLEFQKRMDKLVTAYNAFGTEITVENLDSVRSAFRSAYLQWQVIAAYEFGPAEEVFFRNSLNNFPVNEGLVRNKIAGGNYDFSSPNAYDKGFPALDFMLYGYADEKAALLDSFASNAKLVTYGSKVLDDMKDRTDVVVGKWESGGYAQSFKNNTGTAAGRSFSLIVNSLNENFEILRRNRIGLPSGVLTLNFPNPTEVEGLYSALSLQLAKASLDASRRYFDGDGGEGLDNALNFIKAQKHNQDLSSVIFEQFDKAEGGLAAIPETLSSSVTDNTDLVVDAYNELSPLVVLMKSDMPSVMCIAITYVDNPSDSD